MMPWESVSHLPMVSHNEVMQVVPDQTLWGNSCAQSAVYLAMRWQKPGKLKSGKLLGMTVLGLQSQSTTCGGHLNIPQGPFSGIIYHGTQFFFYQLSLSVVRSSPVNSQYQPQVRPSGFRWNSQGTYHEQRRHPVEARGCRLQTLPNGCDVKSGISCQKMFRQQMLKSQSVQTCSLCGGCFKFSWSLVGLAACKI